MLLVEQLGLMQTLCFAAWHVLPAQQHHSLLMTAYKTVTLGPPYQANVTPCASPSRCLFHHCPK